MRAIVMLGLLSSAFLTLGAQNSSQFQGRWLGQINIPGQRLGLSVDLLTYEDDTWRGTITIPAQGVREFAIAEIIRRHDRISFVIPISGRPSFRGRLSKDFAVLSGTFSQANRIFPFELRKVHAVAVSELGPNVRVGSVRGVPGEGFEGVWNAVLRTPTRELRISFKLQWTLDEVLAGNYSSFDEGVAGWPLDHISVAGSSIELKIKRIQATLKGVMSADGSIIEGKWKQPGGELDIKLGRQAPVRRHQNPSRPFPYQIRDVRFRGGDRRVAIAGTLTLPRATSRMPAVVLLSGSGAQDRDQTILGHRPFWIIADYLSRRGFVVLRTDDRGVGKSTGRLQDSSTDALKRDAIASVEYLRRLDVVDGERVGLVGHSLGGVVAAMAAAEQNSVSYIALLGMPGMRGGEVVAQQIRSLRTVQGVGDELLDIQVNLQLELTRLLAEDREGHLGQTQLRSLLLERALTSSSHLPASSKELIASSIEAIRLDTMTRSLLTTDPLAFLRQVRCPVLVLTGGLDVQAPPDVHHPRIQSALAATGNTRVTITNLPGLNHLFQTADTGQPSEYEGIEETFAPAALQVLEQWLTESSEVSP